MGGDLHLCVIHTQGVYHINWRGKQCVKRPQNVHTKSNVGRHGPPTKAMPLHGKISLKINLNLIYFFVHVHLIVLFWRPS